VSISRASDGRAQKKRRGKREITRKKGGELELEAVPDPRRQAIKLSSSPYKGGSIGGGESQTHNPFGPGIYRADFLMPLGRARTSIYSAQGEGKGTPRRMQVGGWGGGGGGGGGGGDT